MGNDGDDAQDVPPGAGAPHLQLDLEPAPAPFSALPRNAYDLIMADPPWPTKMRSAKGEKKSFARHYGAMSWDEIAALPVGALAAKDAVLFLWATSPHLLYGGDPERHYTDADAARSKVGAIMAAWGFRYVGIGTWLKLTSSGRPAFATGYRLRSCCEFWLLGIRGAPCTSRAARNFFAGRARQHSRKPDEAFEWCEYYLAGARRLELFSRQSRPGWDTWGYEAGKFDPAVSISAASFEGAKTDSATAAAGAAA